MITAEITGIGGNSSVPDNPDAVDAIILHDDTEIGECTLIPNGQNRLDTWGTTENWASHQLIQWLEWLEEKEHDQDIAIDEIVVAVRKAMK